ncbi:pyridoxal phosphate-dependent aminotransferase [Dissulfurispira sp.]|uniref:pyridoxal phosphate-dependent aminotransferase n=1 Tax=Dissulfurispira sp. TaxID=2817609 RepID=UPI002FD929E3
MKHKAWVDAVQRVRAGIESRFDKVRLDKNERLTPFRDDFWRNVISGIRQEHVLAYPEVEPLYEKLGRFLGVSTEQVVITAGSDAAIKTAFDLFVKPGDEVVYLDPTFAMVDVYCGLFNATAVRIGYGTDLRTDMRLLLETVREQVSLIIVANPNSPTGTYIPNDELKTLLEAARRLSIPVLVDEAYYGFCPYTALDLLGEYENLIVTRTFSKTAGLAGLRIGYVVTSPDLAQLLYRFRPMYEVNSVAVHFASAMLDNWHVVDEYIRATDEGKKCLHGALNALSFRTIDTLTNFIHADFGVQREAILKGFDRDGILVRGSLSVKGFEGYTRISIGPISEMEKVVDSIKRSVRI